MSEKANQEPKQVIEFQGEFFGELALVAELQHKDEGKQVEALVTFLAMKKVTYLVSKVFCFFFRKKEKPECH